MGQNYSALIEIKSQTIDETPVQLVKPTVGAIVTVLVASDSAFQYSSSEGGYYRYAGLNSATEQYEKVFPVANALDQLWFKSDSGSIVVEYDCLMNATA